MWTDSKIREHFAAITEHGALPGDITLVRRDGYTAGVAPVFCGRTDPARRYCRVMVFPDVIQDDCRNTVSSAIEERFGGPSCGRDSRTLALKLAAERAATVQVFKWNGMLMGEFTTESK